MPSHLHDHSGAKHRGVYVYIYIIYICIHTPKKYVCMYTNMYIGRVDSACAFKLACHRAKCTTDFTHTLRRWQPRRVGLPFWLKFSSDPRDLIANSGFFLPSHPALFGCGVCLAGAEVGCCPQPNGW